jgi:hypothetical protein
MQKKVERKQKKERKVNSQEVQRGCLEQVQTGRSVLRSLRCTRKNKKQTLCYNADVGRPCLERQKEVNRENVLWAT